MEATQRQEGSPVLGERERLVAAATVDGRPEKTSLQMIGQYSFGGRGGVDAHHELSGETFVEGKQRVGRVGRIDVRRGRAHAEVSDRNFALASPYPREASTSLLEQAQVDAVASSSGRPGPASS